MVIVNILLYLLFGYFLMATLYFFLFSFASVFHIKQRKKLQDRTRRYAVLIPCYKEDAVILEVAHDALHQDYDRRMYDVIVIADSFKAETVTELRKLPITVIEVSFEKSTKAKALNTAMAQIGDDYDVALILDGDNLMEENVISLINDSFDRGFIAVQGHRAAKNLNTNFAILDAISEEIGNSIFRKGQRVLGLSSGLTGSGMAFEYSYFKKVMGSIKAVGGFDKELELKILEDRYIIEYRNDALVYDEKVQKPEVFMNQRRRWISSQGRYLLSAFPHAFYMLLVKGNLNYFNKVFQWLQPPKIIYLGGLFLIAVAVALFHPGDIMKAIWLSLTAISVIIFLMAIPRKFYNWQTLKAMLSLPRAFFLMLLALLRVKGSNSEFIHTEHTSLAKHSPKKTAVGSRN